MSDDDDYKHETEIRGDRLRETARAAYKEWRDETGNRIPEETARFCQPYGERKTVFDNPLDAPAPKPREPSRRLGRPLKPGQLVRTVAQLADIFGVETTDTAAKICERLGIEVVQLTGEGRGHERVVWLSELYDKIPQFADSLDVAELIEDFTIDHGDDDCPDNDFDPD